MRKVDVLVLAGGALTRHRRRTTLSLLGLAIGVAAVVILTALGEGARDFVSGQFDTLDARVLGVVPGKVETTGAVPGIGGTPNDLTLDDAEALARTVPGVERAVPIVIGSDLVSGEGLGSCGGTGTHDARKVSGEPDAAHRATGEPGDIVLEVEVSLGCVPDGNPGSALGNSGPQLGCRGPADDRRLVRPGLG